ncbi:hypothetical protein H5410_005408 [Solanum commersonii]|uniref:Uncharacterized protein n=1 Tax=Solanum commersonii TaxID=4109 RepID=A0A9J6A6C0_SOLCO|nr:hypothetical protein H5410_005408 [Solanum commersonii]
MRLVTVLRDEPETSKGRDPIPYDEHIADLMQKIINMQSEIDQLRNLTNLSITLNTPLPEHGTNTTTPPYFPLVDSPSPQHFSPNPSFHKTNPTAFKQSTNPQQPNFPQNKPQQANPLPFTTPYASQTSLTQTSGIQTNPLNQTTPLTQATQKYQATQHIPAAHTVIPNMQYVLQVYVAEAQPFVTPIPTMPEVDPYAEMEKEARFYLMRLEKKSIESFREYAMWWRAYAAKVQPPMVEIPIIESMEELNGSVFHIKEIMCATQAGKANLPCVLMMVAWEMLKNGFIPSQAFVAQGLEETVEDNLIEALKNLFIEEAECNMILEDYTEAPTIWDAMPGDALNNWTCNPSPVLWESW